MLERARAMLRELCGLMADAPDDAARNALGTGVAFADLVDQMLGRMSMLRHAVDQIPRVVWLVSSGGGAYLNVTARELTGVPVDRLDDFGEVPWQCWHPDGKPIAEAGWPVVRAMAGETVLDAGLIIRGPWRDTYGIRCAVTRPVLDSTRQVIGVYLIGDEIPVPEGVTFD